eukprot:m51a1_g4922 hypothetical protein (2450) ;mRNA; f:235337-245534
MPRDTPAPARLCVGLALLLAPLCASWSPCGLSRTTACVVASPVVLSFDFSSAGPQTRWYRTVARSAGALRVAAASRVGEVRVAYVSAAGRVRAGQQLVVAVQSTGSSAVTAGNLSIFFSDDQTTCRAVGPCGARSEPGPAECCSLPCEPGALSPSSVPECLAHGFAYVGSPSPGLFDPACCLPPAFAGPAPAQCSASAGECRALGRAYAAVDTGAYDSDCCLAAGQTAPRKCGAADVEGRGLRCSNCTAFCSAIKARAPCSSSAGACAWCATTSACSPASAECPQCQSFGTQAECPQGACTWSGSDCRPSRSYGHAAVIAICVAVPVIAVALLAMIGALGYRSYQRRKLLCAQHPCAKVCEVKSQDSFTLGSQFSEQSKCSEMEEIPDQGSLLVAYAGQWCGRKVAIKEVAASNNSKALGDVLKYVAKIDSPHLVALSAIAETSASLYLFEELSMLGSLETIIAQAPDRVHRKGTRTAIALSIARGMLDIHEAGLLHKRLTPENVMVFALDPIEVKITDFAIADLLPERSCPNSNGARRHFAYLAPEVITGGSFSEMSDVYSFAMVCWRLSTRVVPFSDLPSEEAISTFVCSGQRLQTQCRCPLTPVIDSCWGQDPSQRPAFKDLTQPPAASAAPAAGAAPAVTSQNVAQQQQQQQPQQQQPAHGAAPVVPHIHATAPQAGAQPVMPQSPMSARPFVPVYAHLGGPGPNVPTAVAAPASFQTPARVHSAPLPAVSPTAPSFIPQHRFYPPPAGIIVQPQTPVAPAPAPRMRTPLAIVDPSKPKQVSATAPVSPAPPATPPPSTSPAPAAAAPGSLMPAPAPATPSTPIVLDPTASSFVPRKRIAILSPAAPVFQVPGAVGLPALPEKPSVPSTPPRSVTPSQSPQPSAHQVHEHEREHAAASSTPMRAEPRTRTPEPIPMRDLGEVEKKQPEPAPAPVPAPAAHPEPAKKPEAAPAPVAVPAPVVAEPAAEQEQEQKQQQHEEAKPSEKAAEKAAVEEPKAAEQEKPAVEEPKAAAEQEKPKEEEAKAEAQPEPEPAVAAAAAAPAAEQPQAEESAKAEEPKEAKGAKVASLSLAQQKEAAKKEAGGKKGKKESKKDEGKKGAKGKEEEKKPEEPQASTSPAVDEDGFTVVPVKKGAKGKGGKKEAPAKEPAAKEKAGKGKKGAASAHASPSPPPERPQQPAKKDDKAEAKPEDKKQQQQQPAEQAAPEKPSASPAPASAATPTPEAAATATVAAAAEPAAATEEGKEAAKAEEAAEDDWENKDVETIHKEASEFVHAKELQQQAEQAEEAAAAAQTLVLRPQRGPLTGAAAAAAPAGGAAAVAAGGAPVIPPEKYAEGQWSQSNQQGRKQYQREFLLLFQTCSAPPQGLTEKLGIINARNPEGGSGGKQGGGRSGGPSSGMGGRSGQMGPPSGRQGNFRGAPRGRSGRGGRGGARMPLPANVEPLKVSEDGWKRPKLTDAMKIASSKIMAALNKLVAENFEIVRAELLQIDINCRTLLEDLITQIFEKALKEPKWAHMYAHLCYCLSSDLAERVNQIAATEAQPGGDGKPAIGGSGGKQGGGRSGGPSSGMGGRSGQMGPPSGRQGNFRGAPRGRSGRGGRGGARMPLPANVEPLKVSEDGWKRPKLTDAMKIASSKIMAALNKLVAENFEIVRAELLQIDINCRTLLEDLITQIFEKALKEPKWAHMYAHLCYCLSSDLAERVNQIAATEAQPGGDGKPAISFKRILLNKCQEEFEMNQWKANKKKPREGLSEVELQELKLQEDLSRTRFIGNITFIGELFKEAMLTARIMHECIRKLLGDVKDPSHEDMEALCKLLTSIGKKLDTKEAEQWMRAYIDRIVTIIRLPSLPPRIRFLLQGVVDLHSAQWVPRGGKAAAPVMQTPGRPSTSSRPLVAASPVRPAASHAHVTASPGPVRPPSTTPPLPSVSPADDGTTTPKRTLAISRRGSSQHLVPARSPSAADAAPSTPSAAEQRQAAAASEAMATGRAALTHSFASLRPPSTSPDIERERPEPAATPLIESEPSTPIDHTPLSEDEARAFDRTVMTTFEELIGTGAAGVTEAVEVLRELLQKWRHRPSAAEHVLPAALRHVITETSKPLEAVPLLCEAMREVVVEDDLPRERAAAGLRAFLEGIEDTIADASPSTAARALGQFLGRAIAGSVFTAQIVLRELRTAAALDCSVPKYEFGFTAFVWAETAAEYVRSKSVAAAASADGRASDSAATRLRDMIKGTSVDVRDLFEPRADDARLAAWIRTTTPEVQGIFAAALCSEQLARDAAAAGTAAEALAWLHAQAADVAADPEFAGIVCRALVDRLAAKPAPPPLSPTPGSDASGVSLVAELQPWQALFAELLAGRHQCVHAHVAFVDALVRLWVARGKPVGAFYEAAEWATSGEGEAALVGEAGLLMWAKDSRESRREEVREAASDAAELLSRFSDEDDGGDEASKD